MDVQRTVRRYRKHARRQQQAVGRDDQRFRLRGAQPRKRGLILERRRLEDLEPALEGKPLDGARGGTQAATGWTVWLREHQRDLVAGG